MKKNRTIILNESNIHDLKNILVEGYGYVDEYDNVWSAADLITLIVESDYSEDYCGVYTEVQEKMFYWAEEEDAVLRYKNIRYLGGGCIEEADSEEDARDLADGLWHNLTNNEKGRIIVTAYRGKGFTLQDAIEKAEYDSICFFLKYEKREYFFNDGHHEDVYALDYVLDRIEDDSCTDSSDPDYEDIIKAKKNNPCIDRGTYSEDISHLKVKISFPIDEWDYEEEGKICVDGIVEVIPLK